jgi:DNA invertase Pin-like site-specific DNA recombinase
MSQSKLVVAYVRVSTSEQDKNGYGIRIQRHDLRAFAHRNKLKIDRFYDERAETGTLEHRPQLQRLLSACENGSIKTLLIPATDRLSRDVRIAENLFWQFQNMGVSVLIADLPNYNIYDRKSVFLRQIREAVAEEPKGHRREVVERQAGKSSQWQTARRNGALRISPPGKSVRPASDRIADSPDRLCTD